MEDKMKLAWDDPRANRGYVARGRERVTQETDPVKIAQMRASAPDAKESMEIGRDWDAIYKVSYIDASNLACTLIMVRTNGHKVPWFQTFGRLF